MKTFDAMTKAEAVEKSNRLVAMVRHLDEMRLERKRLLEEQRDAGEWKASFETFEEFAESEYGPFIFEELDWIPRE